jgi:hypothetical protein
MFNLLDKLLVKRFLRRNTKLTGTTDATEGVTTTLVTTDVTVGVTEDVTDTSVLPRLTSKPSLTKSSSLFKLRR